MSNTGKKKNKEKSENKSGLSEKNKRFLEKESIDKWMEDIEEVFQQAMLAEKLSIALKAKELLAKSKGWLLGGVASTPKTIKSIDQWTLQEIENVIEQLESYEEPENGKDVEPGSEET